MSLKLPRLDPPVLSAYLIGIQLLSENSELFVTAADAIRAKTSKFDAKIEQQWNMQAGIAEIEGGSKPKLVLEIRLDVSVFDSQSRTKIATYSNHSRAAFEIVGLVGEIDATEIPAKVVEPYLITAADRVRARCHACFRAMNMPVNVPSPRQFGAPQLNATTASESTKVDETKRELPKKKKRG